MILYFISKNLVLVELIILVVGKTTAILMLMVSLEVFLQCSSACFIAKASPLKYDWLIFIYSVT